jgi:peptidyl-dipeptidase Dcp
MKLSSEFSNDFFLDEILFQKVKALYDEKEKLGLTQEQLSLLKKLYSQFTLNGALLSAEGKARLREIDSRLAALHPQFSKNLLDQTNEFFITVSDQSSIKELPEVALEAAREEAKKRGISEPYAFTLQAPSYLPLITYCTDRSIREKIWMALGTRGMTSKYNNEPLLIEIVKLREERAKLLGFSNHAEITLKERMAEKPEKVFDFLRLLIAKAKPKALAEIKELQDFAASLGLQGDLKPWDLAFYSEKLKQKKYSFESEKLRPYFALPQVLEGIFMHAKKLYGLSFKPLDGIQIYHPEAQTFSVFDDRAKEEIGVLFLDLHPRETKKAGAWMTQDRTQGRIRGAVKRPHVGIVCNFTRPTQQAPALLTFDEVTTLFHEFGHALHGLLSNVTYLSTASPNVFLDFVELPSQIFENWVYKKESLELFAKHYQTGEMIPQEFIDKIVESSLFQIGLQYMRQLQFAWLDMAWHTGQYHGEGVEAFEEKILAEFRLLPHVKGTAVSPSFSHIFSGGYSAGYYSYKWAEVLEADAFEAFEEKGIFNPSVGEAFRKEILEKGGTEHPMELYKKFRGREPRVDALLKRDGLQ